MDTIVSPDPIADEARIWGWVDTLPPDLDGEYSLNVAEIELLPVDKPDWAESARLHVTGAGEYNIIWSSRRFDVNGFSSHVEQVFYIFDNRDGHYGDQPSYTQWYEHTIDSEAIDIYFTDPREAIDLAFALTRAAMHLRGIKAATLVTTHENENCDVRWCNEHDDEPGLPPYHVGAEIDLGSEFQEHGPWQLGDEFSTIVNRRLEGDEASIRIQYNIEVELNFAQTRELIADMRRHVDRLEQLVTAWEVDQ